MLLLLAPAIVQALLPEDERATEELFQRFSCQHAYLDLGANIGVQIRKLYQAELYPRAPALSLFNASFGPPPRCRVCSIGVEPNPRHATRLSQLMERYQRAGVGVLVLNAAISDADGFTLLKDHNRTDHWIARHGGTRLQVAAQVDEAVNSSAAGKASVRKLDLASLIHVVDRLLVRMHGARQRASDDSGGPGRISMKMGALRGIELAGPHTQRDQFPATLYLRSVRHRGQREPGPAAPDQPRRDVPGRPRVHGMAPVERRHQEGVSGRAEGVREQSPPPRLFAHDERRRDVRDRREAVAVHSPL